MRRILCFFGFHQFKEYYGNPVAPNSHIRYSAYLCQNCSKPKYERKKIIYEKILFPTEIENRLRTEIKNIRAFVPEESSDSIKFSILFPENKLFMITIPTSGVGLEYGNVFPFTYSINKEIQYQNAWDIDAIITFIKTVTN
jgi:hypothetical protein